jgi:hypothetical protein
MVRAAGEMCTAWKLSIRIRTAVTTAATFIYGRGDDDSTWGTTTLTGPIQHVERKPK